jgi:glycosyltransferase involved in cell wall biosynthesis
MKILLLNWRSIKDPLAGGAELATIEFAKRWVSKHNAEVFWISAPYNKDITHEEIDGIKFIYLGIPLKRDETLKMLFHFPYFYLLVILEYFKNFKGKIDVVIDQSHGFPFLTPLYVTEKKILFIHEYADIIWDKMFNFPINKIGKFLENLILNLYTKLLTVTCSNGTKNDLVEKIGFNEKNITIVNYATNLKPLKKPIKKYDIFTILYLNRVVKMKRPDAAIRIFAKLVSKVKIAQLIIIGKYEEEYFRELINLAENLNVKDKIIFKGHMAEERVEFLQKSHILINTSVKEGWGIVNIEANSQGTPVVAFNVEGCRESVKNGVSGYIADTEDEFVEKILKLKEENLQQSSIEYSKQFNYDDKSEDFWRVINGK